MDLGERKPGTISSGISAYGYDMRLGYKFGVFSPIYAQVIDPKNFDKRCLVEVDLSPSDLDYDPITNTWAEKFLLIPPHSFVLAESLERFKVPRDTLGVVLGKSTYARCFSAGTRVRLADGTSPTLKEMADRWIAGEREFYGYGWSEKHGYVVQKFVAPRKVGRDKILRVTLDNGKVVRCTADHQFCLRYGGSKRADELKTGDSLLPLYTSVTGGYERVWDPFARKFRGTSHLTDDMLVRQGKRKPRQEFEDVHHEDENKRNNYPDNLKRLTEQEHGRLHNSKRDMSAVGKMSWQDPEQKKAHLERLSNPELHKRAGESRRQFYATEYGKKVKLKANKKAWATRGEKGRKAQSELLIRLKTRHDVTEDRVREALNTVGTVTGAAKYLKADVGVLRRRFRNVLEEFKAAKQNNHKVVSVEFTDKEEDVYCLTAPDTGNFALAAGVIVHNCGLIVNCTPMEPEWEGVLTIELSNTTPLPLKVYPGEGIAQVLFIRSDEKRDRFTGLMVDYFASRDFGFATKLAESTGKGDCERSYKDKKGRYQAQTGITPPSADTTPPVSPQ